MELKARIFRSQEHRNPIAGSRDEQGTSMLEMVVVAPILLVLLFGIAEFGIAFGQWQTLSNAAREGARVGVVRRDPALCPATAPTDVVNAVTNYAATLIADPVAVNHNGLCTGAGTPVTVTATVPYNFQVLPGLAGLPTSITLVGSSTMRNE